MSSHGLVDYTSDSASEVKPSHVLLDHLVAGIQLPDHRPAEVDVLPRLRRTKTVQRSVLDLSTCLVVPFPTEHRHTRFSINPTRIPCTACILPPL